MEPSAHPAQTSAPHFNSPAPHAPHYPHAAQQGLQSHTASTASLLQLAPHPPPPPPFPPAALGLPPALLSSASTVSLPRGQLSLRDRVEIRNLQVHHARLRAVQPSIHGKQRDAAAIDMQTHTALLANHVATVARQAHLRAEEIARKNAAIVGKITRTVLASEGPYAQSRETNPYKGSKHARPFVHRSLNLGRRRAEQARIASENLVLARRIIERTPQVAGKGEWDKHASKHGRILANISKYIELPAGSIPPFQGAAAASAAYGPQLTPAQLYQQQQFAQQYGSVAIPIPPQGLPPGYTVETYTHAMRQQLFLQAQQAQMQHQQSLSQSPSLTGAQFSMPHAAHSYLRPTSSAGSVTSGAGGGSQHGGSGPFLPPMAQGVDAAKRSARLQRKLLQAEKERFGPSATTERLLRPLQRNQTRSQQQQQPYSSRVPGMDHPQQFQHHPPQHHGFNQHTSGANSASSSLAQSPAQPRGRGAMQLQQYHQQEQQQQQQQQEEKQMYPPTAAPHPSDPTPSSPSQPHPASSLSSPHPAPHPAESVVSPVTVAPNTDAVLVIRKPASAGTTEQQAHTGHPMEAVAIATAAAPKSDS